MNTSTSNDVNIDIPNIKQALGTIQRTLRDRTIPKAQISGKPAIARWVGKFPQLLIAFKEGKDGQNSFRQLLIAYFGRKERPEGEGGRTHPLHLPNLLIAF